MIRLIIQIPCHDEATTLPQVLTDLPTRLEGVDRIETLVIDDGSTDDTAAVARACGATHVISLGTNRGLANAYEAGLHRAVELGADIIVNTDGDNQYDARGLPDLIAPILEGRADMVIGCRPIERIREFSWMKKRLQRLGSRVVRWLSGVDVPDTASGFRAFTADTALRLSLFNRYSYTLESIIQAQSMNLRIEHVPIEVNPKTRESRLFRSSASYIRRQAAIILRAYLRYQPLRTFFYLALPPLVAGIAIGIRFLYYFFVVGETGGKIQSLVLGTTLLTMAFLLIVLGLLGDLTATNRRLAEENQYLLRSMKRTLDHGPRQE